MFVCLFCLLLACVHVFGVSFARLSCLFVRSFACWFVRSIVHSFFVYFVVCFYLFVCLFVCFVCCGMQACFREWIWLVGWLVYLVGWFVCEVQPGFVRFCLILCLSMRHRTFVRFASLVCYSSPFFVFLSVCLFVAAI